MKTTHAFLPTQVFPNLSTLKGVPGTLLDEMKGRYATAIAKTNEIFERLETVDRNHSHPVFSDLRSLLTALPSSLATVKSYELFFRQFGGKGNTPTGLMADQIVKDFGSYTHFIDTFTSTAIASRGWAAVVYDLDLKRMMCVIGDTPEQLTVWNTAPIIVFEVTERGSAPGYGPDRTAYLQALIDHLDWRVIEANLERALALQQAQPTR